MKYFLSFILFFIIFTSQATLLTDLQNAVDDGNITLENAEQCPLYSLNRFEHISNAAQRTAVIHNVFAEGSQFTEEEKQTILQIGSGALTNLIHATYEAGGLRRMQTPNGETWTIDQSALTNYLAPLREQDEADVEQTSQLPTTSACLTRSAQNFTSFPSFSFETVGEETPFPPLFFFHTLLSRSSAESAHPHADLDLLDAGEDRDEQEVISSLIDLQLTEDSNDDDERSTQPFFVFDEITDKTLKRLQEDLQNIFNTLKELKYPHLLDTLENEESDFDEETEDEDSAHELSESEDEESVDEGTDDEGAEETFGLIRPPEPHDTGFSS